MAYRVIQNGKDKWVGNDATKPAVTPAEPTAAFKALQNKVVVSPAVTPNPQPAAGSAPAIPTNVTAEGSVSASSSWSPRKSTYTRQAAPERSAFVRPDFDRAEFETSADTDRYQNLLKATEGSKPGEFESRYEGAIQSILDGILNKKSFDLASDANYNLLYNQAREQYMNAGDKAMRDTMGAMQAQTGGYGSTAATAAGSQAYDNYLQGLNEQNAALAQLAYQMYGNEMADRYNQLGAVQGLDQTDYGRYRDTVGDWMADRDYYANMYQNMYNNDWNRYQFDTSMDWDEYKYGTTMDWNQYQYDTDRDWEEYQYANNMDYQLARDALSDYDDAFNMAYKLASQGQAIPARYASYLDDDTKAQLQGLAAQAVAGGSGGGRSGRSGGGSRGGGSGAYPTTQSTGGIDWEDVIALYRKSQEKGATEKDKTRAANALKELEATRPDQVQYYRAALRNSGR